jgi:hypothetical protein
VINPICNLQLVDDGMMMATLFVPFCSQPAWESNCKSIFNAYSRYKTNQHWHGMVTVQCSIPFTGMVDPGDKNTWRWAEASEQHQFYQVFYRVLPFTNLNT